MNRVTPELRQLRYFVTVAEERSFTRAAGRLHIAQQSLSQQIRTLESQLGVTLFERSSHGVELTDIGAVLLREARPVLAQAERVVEAVRRAARGEAGELRVGFLSSVANYVMPPIVRAFRERHPDVTLRTEDVTIAALVAGLREGSLDAGLSRPPLVEDLETEVVLREPVAAVLPEGHPLADRDELTLADLADEPWVLTPRVLAALAPSVRRRLRPRGLSPASGRARNDPAEPPGACGGGRRRHSPSALSTHTARQRRGVRAARRGSGRRGGRLAPGRAEPGPARAA
jgi:DNA-binding transcriptional LysR family regulator